MMEKVYSRPSGIFEGAVTGFCPGCMHSSVCKVVAEVLDELGMVDNACYVQGVGCCGLAVTYFDMDTVAAPHGRACAIASSFKRCSPETLVFTYQGDGDLAAIGLAETMSAANRGENFTVIFVNNGIYGMTGGQMAPTTLLGVKATTDALRPRRPRSTARPMHMCEILSQLDSPGIYRPCGPGNDVRQCQQGQGRRQEGLPVPARRQGLLLRRVCLQLPDELGHEPAGVPRPCPQRSS